MNTDRKYLSRHWIRLALLLLVGALIAVLAGVAEQPVQAGPAARKSPDDGSGRVDGHACGDFIEWNAIE